MTPRMVERPSSLWLEYIREQEYLFVSYPERSSLLIRVGMPYRGAVARAGANCSGTVRADANARDLFSYNFLVRSPASGLCEWCQHTYSGTMP
jgi:hypothetical protein